MKAIPLKTLEQLARLALQFEPCLGSTDSDESFSLMGHITYEEAGRRDLLVVLKELEGKGTIRLNSQVSVGACEYGTPTTWSHDVPSSWRLKGWAIELFLEVNLNAEAGE